MNEERIPYITIQSKWLKEEGFIPGDNIEKLNGNNMLVLIKNGNKYLDNVLTKNKFIQIS